MAAYYNEVDLYAAEWLRNLCKAGLIPDGEVDCRSIRDVRPDDIFGFEQCHFFAGIGGWALAARLARWADDRPLWTGSPPCQPWSAAGEGRGAADERHLWPELFRLIRAARPSVIMGEQVAAAVGKAWLDGVFADMESIGYACGAAIVPACGVDAPHERDRLWFVADAHGTSRERQSDAQIRREVVGASVGRPSAGGRNGSFWADSEWLVAGDGKARRAPSCVRLVAHGVPGRVGRLRAYGNAIVPALAAEVIGAYLDTLP